MESDICDTKVVLYRGSVRRPMAQLERGMVRSFALRHHRVTPLDVYHPVRRRFAASEQDRITILKVRCFTEALPAVEQP